ncbi:MAG TPA: hypothetical protein VKU94_07360 [Geobacterales bacterium]|nr:hypothetical protein [Geobacterales bacterium]
MSQLRKDILFHNTVDVWIHFCEVYKVDWGDIQSYLDFINYLSSLGIRMNPMNLCIKETGGMYQRGKKKADFLDALTKLKKGRPVYTIKLDKELEEKINEYFRAKTLK